MTVTDPIAVTLTPTSASLALGGPQVFTATITGTSNAALDWYVNGVLNGNTAQGKLTACTTLAPLTCTYTAPPVNVPRPNPAVIEVASSADPGKFKTANVTVTDPIAVTLTPTSASLALGGPQVFTATITGATSNAALDWYVNGALNGNTAQGKITACTTVAPRTTCTYTVPPVNVPSPNPVVIKLASSADPGKYQTASVTVNDPIQVTLSPASASIALGATHLFTATITGATSNAALNWYVNGVRKGNSTQGTISGCTTGTTVTCTYTPPPVDVPSPNPAVIEVASSADAGKYQTASVTVTDSIAVSLIPSTATVALKGTQVFTATVSNTTNHALKWYVNGVLEGSSTQGTLTACTTSAPLTCKYTAPLAYAPDPNPAVIKVASAADPSKYKTARVTVTGAFGLTGTLHTSRIYHTATLLNNGLVLMAGGSDGMVTPSSTGNPISSAELYNPATGIFTAVGSLNTARYFHTATLLNNGLVLIAGGNVGGTTTIASAELYDPATGTFTPTGSLHTARYDHTATLLNNGMVLIAGGIDSGNELSSAELYNPATGTFTPTGSLKTARRGEPATPLNNGMVLIAGGYHDANLSFLASAELYNPATGKFTYTGSLNTARFAGTATLLNNGMVLMTGGESCSGCLLSSAELYNPGTGTFTLTGSLNTALLTHMATLLNNGMVLIAGGQNPIGTNLAGAELYNTATGTFSSTANLNTARSNPTATLLNNGTVLIAGGQNTSSAALASAELYEPVTLTPPNLVSIAITPATSTLSPGATQQFIATGTFSDNSTQQLASVTWSSSNRALAQISNDTTNHGVGLAIAAGTVTIKATAGSVGGLATLTVQ